MKRIETRTAVRALILSDSNEVLLLQMKHPKHKGYFWLLPGGGVNSNEELVVALAREVWEETGWEFSGTPTLIWRRTHRFERGFNKSTTPVDQHEYIYLVHSQRFEPTSVNNPDLSKVGVFNRFCWWSATALKAAEGERFAPRSLPQLVYRLIAEGPPSFPTTLTD